MNQSFLVPCYYMVAHLVSNLKQQGAPDRHTLGQIQTSWKGSDAKFHLSPGTDYRRKPSICRNTGQEEFGIKLPYLVFYWNEDL